MDKEKTIQVKFTVDEEQYKRLEILAKMRDMSIPQFCKLTSLGVKIKPAQPIIINGEYMMPEEEILLLKEVTERYHKESQFFKYDKEFNERLYQYAKGKMKEEKDKR